MTWKLNQFKTFFHLLPIWNNAERIIQNVTGFYDNINLSTNATSADEKETWSSRFVEFEFESPDKSAIENREGKL